MTDITDIDKLIPDIDFNIDELKNYVSDGEKITEKIF